MTLTTADAEATAIEVTPQVRSLQVIHGALMGGVVAYLIFVVSKGISFAEDDGAPPLIPLGFAAMSAVMSFVVPPIVRQAGLAAFRGKPDIAARSLVDVFQTGHIVGVAMLEGAGLLACFALTGGFGGMPRWFVAVPLALIVLMLVRFPRVASVAQWVSMTREELAMGA
jgi:hypothetical protein